MARASRAAESARSSPLRAPAGCATPRRRSITCAPLAFSPRLARPAPRAPPRPCPCPAPPARLLRRRSGQATGRGAARRGAEGGRVGAGQTLPFLSSVKSPQQVAGSLLKRRAAALLGRPANQARPAPPRAPCAPRRAWPSPPPRQQHPPSRSRAPSLTARRTLFRRRSTTSRSCPASTRSSRRAAAPRPRTTTHPPRLPGRAARPDVEAARRAQASRDEFTLPGEPSCREARARPRPPAPAPRRAAAPPRPRRAPPRPAQALERGGAADASLSGPPGTEPARRGAPAQRERAACVRARRSLDRSKRPPRPGRWTWS